MRTSPAAPEHKALPAPVQTAPGPWKKCSFYTIRRDKTDKGMTAHRAEGFTDGLFNYYSAGDKSKVWHAVHPVFGLSVANASTRKAAQADALKNLDKIRAAEATMDPRTDKCAAMIRAAQDGDNMTLF